MEPKLPDSLKVCRVFCLVRGFCLILAGASILWCHSTVAAQQQDEAQQNQESVEPSNSSDETPVEASAPSEKVGMLIRVPLPLTSNAAKRVRQSIDRMVEQAPVVVRPEDRMRIVLEFDTSGGKTGRGSEFGACFELARFLSSISLTKVKIIAYIPGPQGYFDPDANEQPSSFLSGHAVLVAISTHEIVMHENASLGEASIDEASGDETVINSYLAIAKRRFTLPPAVVQAMVDSDSQLFRVSTSKGVVYADAAKQAELESDGDVIETRTLSQPGQLARFSSEELADFRLIRRRVASKAELARQLELSPYQLQGDPTLGRKWDAVEIPFPPYVDGESVRWVSRALDARDSNLIILRLMGTDADPDACLLMARKLASYNSNEVRTVAFVESDLKGPGALVALCCDHILMAPEAEILGPGDRELDEQTLGDFRGPIQELARARGGDWSLLMASLDPALTVNRYRNRSTGQVRLLSEEEHESLKDGADWLLLGPLPTDEGLDAESAEQLLIARSIVPDMAALATFYQLNETPEILKRTAADRWLKKLAETLGSPLIAPWLMLGAFFFLSTEMSAPGIGVPGFLGTLCLMLFFWSQYLGGNAHWLEILMFVTGVIFILLEIFAIPGFGLFGIGGGIMVVTSIVLASQTFIVPTSREEFAQLPYSLLPLVGAGTGLGVALFTLRNVLPNTPYLRRMMLQPRERDPLAKSIESDPEAIVDWAHLFGRTGETVTRLFPAGKARIAGEVFDVISDGRMIDKGTPVKVTEVSGNRILVQPIDGE